MTTTQLDPRLQKLVDLGESGTDILHGELKNRMLEAETKLERCDQDDEREWLDGYMQALTDVYKLTYDLSFAISDRRKKYA
jgi:hypothetical protein